MSDTEPRDTGGPRVADLQMPPIPRALPMILAPLHEQGFADGDVVFAATDCDPSLKSKILNYINAQIPRSTDDFERAVQLVGPTTAAGLVIGLCLRRWTALRDGPAGAALLRLVYHTEATAVLTQRLVQRHPGTGSPSDNEDGDTSAAWSGFTKGFVHDLGKLVLLYNYPEKAAALYNPQRTADGYEGTSPQTVERHVLGCDHTEAAARAASALNLPPPLVEVATRHHDDLPLDEHGSNAGDLHAVRAANLLTKTMGSEVAGLSAITARLDWESCASDPVWSRWQSRPTGTAPDALRDELTESIVLYTQFFLDLPDIQLISQHE